MAEPSDVPLGFCKKCGMARIRQEGIPICPSCDTKPATKSGLVNKYKDPGERMDANGNLIGTPEIETHRITEGVNTADVSVVQSTLMLEPPITAPIDIVSDAVNRIDSVLCNMKLSDFADLREARKVMKYRKKLANLKLELQDFLG